MMLYECDGLCGICKFRKTPIDGEHCGPCGNDFANFMPDWVDLICTHFKVSRNQAKKIYHKMVEDWRIRKNMEKLTEGLSMSIRDLFLVMDSMTSESIIAVRDITGKAIFEGELHLFSSHHTALFKNQNITHVRYREDIGTWEIEIW